MGLVIGSKVACVYAIDASLLARASAVGLRRPSEACVSPQTIFFYSMTAWPAAYFPAAPSTRRQLERWAGGISWVADLFRRNFPNFLNLNL